MPRRPPAAVPRPLREVVTDALADLLADQPASPHKLAFAWRAAVGPALARATSVTLEGTTLVVEVAGPLWAPEVQRAVPELLGRLERLLGAGVVRAIAVKAPGSATPRRRPPARRPR